MQTQPRSTIEWVRPSDRLPEEQDYDECGYVLIAMSNQAKPVVKMAKYDRDAWVDIENFVVPRVHLWAAMPKPEVTT